MRTGLIPTLSSAKTTVAHPGRLGWVSYVRYLVVCALHGYAFVRSASTTWQCHSHVDEAPTVGTVVCSPCTMLMLRCVSGQRWCCPWPMASCALKYWLPPSACSTVRRNPCRFARARSSCAARSSQPRRHQVRHCPGRCWSNYGLNRCASHLRLALTCGLMRTVQAHLFCSFL